MTGTSPLVDAGYSVWRLDLWARLIPLLLLVAAGTLASVVAGRMLWTRLRWRWRALHAHQHGTSEMEFALAFPFFLMMVLLTVQMALLVNANLIVDYAAFCAARSASVWLPQDLPGEGPNTIDGDQSHPGKWRRIRRAASIACTPISPRFTSFVGGFLGGVAPGVFDNAGELGNVASGLGLGSAYDGVQFGTILLDKLASSYLLTDVELYEGGGGQPQRSFGEQALVTARVTHRFYMNVPFAGPLLGEAFGQRFGYFFGPHYVPVSASYTLMAGHS